MKFASISRMPRETTENAASACPVIVFTAPGRVHRGALEPGPEPAVRIEGATYAPGDRIGGEKIVGVSVPKGTGSRRAAAFNAATLRLR